MKVSYKVISELYHKMDYKFYDNGNYNVNLFGIRSTDDLVDEFNDVLGIAYRDDFGNPVCLTVHGTTKPGLYYLKNKMGNSQGTAILMQGYYSKCWRIGEHQGYKALVQNSELAFRVWRDNNSDGKLDMDSTVYTNVTGLNMHTTSFINEKDRVGAYSAGCQVRQRHEDHQIAMFIISRSAAIYGNSFSYALFTDDMLK